MRIVNNVGWYWFLPDEQCPSPTGFLRIDQPVVLLVSVDKFARDGKPPPFVVKFPAFTMSCADMLGDWEPISPPNRMRIEATRRYRDRIERKPE